MLAAGLPQYGTDVHLGVASCAGSNCHGSIEPWAGSRVLQNEYVTWSTKDQHAKAYEHLLSDESKRIARNLGIGAPHTEGLCLDCHADNAASGKRGRQFQISDGVGCEACHGGAQRWLGPHVSTVFSRQDFFDMGMYPTEDPVERAQLCLSCHFGSDRKFVTHRLMGAGHPRMSFELDTFTAIQPAHYVVDDDYRRRKTVIDGVQTWAIGQALALIQSLDAIADSDRNRDGLFPELVLFDCQACHHNLKDVRWQARASTGLGPGVVRLNDANLVMLRLIVRHFSPPLAERLTAEGRTLHQAAVSDFDAMVTAARQLKNTVSEAVSLLSRRSFTEGDMRALWSEVLAAAQTAEYQDYAAAEQATMALGSIAQAMRDAGMLGDTAYRQIADGIDRVHDTVFEQYEYKPADFRSALGALARVRIASQ